MTEMSREKKVGWTLLASLAALGALVVFLGRIHLNAPGYALHADFSYVDSLKPDAPVLYGGGVKIGSVEGLDVVDGKVRVDLHILKHYRIPKDSTVTVHTSGILGEKYVQFDAGDTSTGMIEEGAVLQGIDPGSLDRTLQRIEALTDFLAPLLKDPKFKKGFGQIVDNVQQITEQLGSLINDSSGDIRESVKNLKALSAGLRDRADELKGVVDSAKGMVNEKNRKNLEESLQSLDSTLGKLDKAMTEIDNKKGPLGAMIYDEETANNLREILRDLKSHPWKLLWKK
jgi:phospholipid/cholesterol/gamma-HCH transport system substrate-binding protein